MNDESYAKIISKLLTNAVNNFATIGKPNAVMALECIVDDKDIIADIKEHKDVLNKLAEGMYQITKDDEIALNKKYYDDGKNIIDFLFREFADILTPAKESPSPQLTQLIFDYISAFMHMEKLRPANDEYTIRHIFTFHEFVGAQGGGETYDFWKHLLCDIANEKIKPDDNVSSRLSTAEQVRDMIRFLSILQREKLPILVNLNPKKPELILTDAFKKDPRCLLPYLMSLITHGAAHDIITAIQLFSTFYCVQNTDDMQTIFKIAKS